MTDDAESAGRRATRRICALFDRCREEGGARGTRDAALISVLFGAGVAREVAVALPVGAYRPATGILTWRRSPAPPPRPDAGPPATDPVGRLQRRRAVSGARSVLDDWIGIRGRGPGPLMCRLIGEGVSAAPWPLTPDDVSRILEVRARAAGVRAFSVSAFRHLYDSPWWEEVPPGGPAGQPAEPGG